MVKADLNQVNPLTLQHKCWDLPSIRTQAERLGLTLGGALYTALNGRAWRRQMGQYLSDREGSMVECTAIHKVRPISRVSLLQW